MKRLLFSALTVGAVAAALTYGAYAYFFDGATSAITANSADPLDLKFDVDEDCNGVYEATGLDVLPAATTDDLYPGDSNSACIQVHNPSTTDVDVYVRNSNFGGSAALLAALGAKVENLNAASTPCSQQTPDAAQYTTANSGRGCWTGNVAGGGSVVLKATVKFVDDGTDQSALASLSATWDTNVGGYTTP